nr:MAG TPA: hypothetical protein [Caudoviricetes sp.]
MRSKDNGGKLEEVYTNRGHGTLLSLRTELS